MNKIIEFLQQGLDGASARQKAISKNIANVDTPGYKRKDVDFISQLNAKLHNSHLSLKVTDDKHITRQKRQRPFKEITLGQTNYRNDGNNVDIDVEMAELAKNNLYYNTLAQQINARFRLIKDVISKGSR